MRPQVVNLNRELLPVPDVVGVEKGKVRRLRRRSADVSRPGPAAVVTPDHHHAPVCSREGGQDLRRFVRRTVVDNHEGESAVALPEHRKSCLAQVARTVENRHNDGHRRPVS